MTAPVSDQQRRKRRIFRGLAIVFLVGVAAIWIVNMGNGLSGVLGIAFTLLGILIAFLQWQPQPRLEVQMLTGGIATNEPVQQQFYQQIEGLTLEVNKRKGGLVVYTRKDLRGSTINLSFGFHNSNPKVDLVSNVIGRKRKGSTSTVYSADFSPLEPGDYTVHTDSHGAMTKVNIVPGRVVEVDWR